MKLQALDMTRSMLASGYSKLLKMMTMRLIGREKLSIVFPTHLRLGVMYRFTLANYSPRAHKDIPQISVERLTKHYATVVALDNVSFDIGYGEFFEPLSPYGPGMTTRLTA